eukprot:9823613-Alexandrium_andersonii.AAC.1
MPRSVAEAGVQTAQPVAEAGVQATPLAAEAGVQCDWTQRATRDLRRAFGFGGLVGGFVVLII